MQKLIKLSTAVIIMLSMSSAFAASALYLVVGVVPVLIALVGTHIAPELGHRDEFLPALAQQVLPPLLFALLMGALVSAILSTVDSSLLTIASLTAHTFIVDRWPDLSERGKVRLSRAMVVVAGIVSAVVATSGENIYDLVVSASAFGTAGVLVVVVVGLWSRHGGSITALATLAVGAGATVGANHFGVEAPFLAALFAAMLTYAGVAGWEGRRGRG